MAGMRSASGTPTNIPTSNEAMTSTGDVGLDTSTASTAGQPASSATGPRTYQSAQTPRTTTYQRPTKRRHPPQRDQSHVARDSLIDQIMNENEAQVPIYERSSTRNITLSRDSAGQDVDNDAAAAEAFKAQLLVDLELGTRKRAPKKVEPGAPTGPKLGGSRSQREKMRALEEAGKGGAGAGGGGKK